MHTSAWCPCKPSLLTKGKTSITVKVRVEAERQHGERQIVRVTQAEVVYVRVDENRRPLPLDAET